MNINKFTQNSLQAVQNCEKIAMDYGNQELAQEHLLYALLTQDDSLIAKLMEKMGLDKNMVINRVEESLRKLPKVQGGQQYVGQALNNVLVHAEDEAKQMGDEYVSVEHLFLAMIKYAGKEMKSILRELGISRDGFLQALSSVRGNQRVTSDMDQILWSVQESRNWIQSLVVILKFGMLSVSCPVRRRTIRF